MAKYNITEKKEKEAAYRSLVSPRLMDELKEKILDIILIQKKYKDKDYSAKKLAEDLGTNTRYISAVVNVRFHVNYTSFVNKFRIDEAMTLLVDKRNQDVLFTPPAGSPAESVPDESGNAKLRPEEPGLYRVMCGGEEAGFYTVIPAEESEGGPLEELTLLRDVDGEEEREEAASGLWRIAAAVLLAVLLTEWGIYIYEQR